uniref:Uncharacterized protein n=1 Tax=Anguilla anguilla TaxID=7936 RepID=A0A0E9PXI7_ANGAN
MKIQNQAVLKTASKNTLKKQKTNRQKNPKRN